MSEPGLLAISSGTIRENNNRWYILKYPIFPVEIVNEYTIRYTKSCVWISVKMNMSFGCTLLYQNPGIQYKKSRPGPRLTTHFTNTRSNLLRRVVVRYPHLYGGVTNVKVCEFEKSHVHINPRSCAFAIHTWG